MLPLIAPNAPNQESGFSILEVMTVLVISGVMAAVAGPNVIGALRQSEVNRVFTEVNGAIQQAQANANRQSIDCTLTIAETTAAGGSPTYTIDGSPAGCVLEPVIIDRDIISITSTRTGPPWNVSFDFQGTTTVNDLGTYLIARRDGAGNVIEETGKCIVISSAIGMIRTGIYAPDNTITPNDSNTFPDCVNVENQRYDNES